MSWAPIITLRSSTSLGYGIGRSRYHNISFYFCFCLWVTSHFTGVPMLPLLTSEYPLPYIYKQDLEQSGPCFVQGFKTQLWFVWMPICMRTHPHTYTYSYIMTIYWAHIPHFILCVSWGWGKSRKRRTEIKIPPPKKKNPKKHHTSLLLFLFRGRLYAKLILRLEFKELFHNNKLGKCRDLRDAETPFIFFLWSVSFH